MRKGSTHTAEPHRCQQRRSWSFQFQRAVGFQLRTKLCTALNDQTAPDIASFLTSLSGRSSKGATSSTRCKATPSCYAKIFYLKTSGAVFSDVCRAGDKTFRNGKRAGIALTSLQNRTALDCHQLFELAISRIAREISHTILSL